MTAFPSSPRSTSKSGFPPSPRFQASCLLAKVSTLAHRECLRRHQTSILGPSPAAASAPHLQPSCFPPRGTRVAIDAAALLDRACNIRFGPSCINPGYRTTFFRKQNHLLSVWALRRLRPCVAIRAFRSLFRCCQETHQLGKLHIIREQIFIIIARNRAKHSLMWGSCAISRFQTSADRFLLLDNCYLFSIHEFIFTTTASMSHCTKPPLRHTQSSCLSHNVTCNTAYPSQVTCRNWRATRGRVGEYLGANGALAGLFLNLTVVID